MFDVEHDKLHLTTKDLSNPDVVFMLKHFDVDGLQVRDLYTSADALADVSFSDIAESIVTVDKSLGFRICSQFGNSIDSLSDDDELYDALLDLLDVYYNAIIDGLDTCDSYPNIMSFLLDNSSSDYAIVDNYIIYGK